MLKLIFVTSLFFSGTLFGQELTQKKCGDVLTETSKQKPIFKKSKEDIEVYFKDLVSFRSQEQFRGIFKVMMNCRGEIYQAEMIKGNLSESVKKEIQLALLKMPEWQPANYDGTVNYLFYIDFLFKGEELSVNTIMR